MKRIFTVFCALMLLVGLAVPAAAAELTPVGMDMSLRAPAGILVSKDGTFYVADSERNQILAINGEKVAVVAGHMLPENFYGKPAGGYLDAKTETALFDGPTAMVEWGGGIVISDTENHVIRLVKDGMVRTLAGSGEEGMRNGVGSNVQFSRPMGLAVGSDGALYVADSGNGVIRKITEKGDVSTAVTGLEMPAGLFWYDNALYVSDAGSNRILKVMNSKTEILAGASVRDGEEWSSGFSDGPALKATFFQPKALWVTKDAVYIADSGNAAIRVLQDGRVSTLAHNAGGAALYPAEPVALWLSGSTLYVADQFAGGIYKLSVDAAYSDVKPGDWHHDSIRILTRMGLMSGTGNNQFTPDGKFTRAMVASVLMRYEASRDRDVILDGEATFPDVAATAWYASAASWIADSGLMTGYPDGNFGGNDPLTREQCASILYRYAGKLGADMNTTEDLSAFDDAGMISDYAVEAMRWAVGNGILSGGGNGRLSPTQTVTRAQLCVMLRQWSQVVEG